MVSIDFGALMRDSIQDINLCRLILYHWWGYIQSGTSIYRVGHC